MVKNLGHKKELVVLDKVLLVLLIGLVRFVAESGYDISNEAHVDVVACRLLVTTIADAPSDSMSCIGSGIRGSGEFQSRTSGLHKTSACHAEAAITVTASTTEADGFSVIGSMR